MRFGFGGLHSDVCHGDLTRLRHTLEPIAIVHALRGAYSQTWFGFGPGCGDRTRYFAFHYYFGATNQFIWDVKEVIRAQ